MSLVYQLLSLARSKCSVTRLLLYLCRVRGIMENIGCFRGTIEEGIRMADNPYLAHQLEQVYTRHTQEPLHYSLLGHTTINRQIKMLECFFKLEWSPRYYSNAQIVRNTCYRPNLIIKYNLFWFF